MGKLEILVIELATEFRTHVDEAVRFLETRLVDIDAKQARCSAQLDSLMSSQEHKPSVAAESRTLEVESSTPRRPPDHGEDLSLQDPQLSFSEQTVMYCMHCHDFLQKHPPLYAVAQDQRIEKIMQQLEVMATSMGHGWTPAGRCPSHEVTDADAQFLTLDNFSGRIVAEHGWTPPREVLCRRMCRRA